MGRESAFIGGFEKAALKAPKITFRTSKNLARSTKPPKQGRVNFQAAADIKPKTTKPKAPKPKAAPANVGVSEQPGIVERIRQGLTTPGNKIRTYAGMGIVGGGVALYGGKKLLDSTIGPSRPQHDW